MKEIMQVPGFLLIILTVLSALLLVVILTVAFFVIKNWIRLRKYEKIKPTKPVDFIPGKTETYFGLRNEDNHVIPLMCPSTVQLDGQFVRQSMLNQISAPNSVCSYGSARRVTISAFEKRSVPRLSRGNVLTVDDTLRSATFTGKDTDMETKRNCSPGLSSLAGSDISNTRSPQSSVTEGIHEVSRLPLSTYSIYSNENTPERCNSNVYSHSQMFEDRKDVTLVADHGGYPVISYDQEDTILSSATSLGSLSFVLQYDAVSPELLITVKHAIDLPNSTGNKNGIVNSYINLCIVPEDFLWKRTRIIENDNDPVFNETFQIKDVLYHKLREYTICFYVMDCHPLMGERPIGKVLFPLSDLRAEQIVNITKDLTAP